MVKNASGQNEPQTLDTKALEQRLVDVVDLVRDAKDCEQLRRRLWEETYIDGAEGKWRKYLGKFPITEKGAVLALAYPVDDKKPKKDWIWQSYDLQGKSLRMLTGKKHTGASVVTRTREKLLETPFAQVLVKVMGKVKTAKDPKKLYDDVWEIIEEYPDARKLFPQQ